jgi:hypothetical protein
MAQNEEIAWRPRIRLPSSDPTETTRVNYFDSVLADFGGSLGISYAVTRTTAWIPRCRLR